MSLTIAYKVAEKGLALTESKLGAVSANINNASVAGYTRKAYQSQYITSESVTTPVGGEIVQSTIDNALQKQLNTQSTAYAADQMTSSYLNDYSDSFGSTSDSATTLSSTIDAFTAALNTLEGDPTQTSAKSAVVSTAQQAASQLNGLSQSIQAQRLQASNSIGTSIASVNSDLTTIASLNGQISAAMVTGDDAADLTDQRNNALADLSQQMGVQSFINNNDEMTVYTTNGSLLVSSGFAGTFAYTPVGTVSSSTTYPGGFSGITLNGTDVTSKMTSGTLGALVTLRDTTLTGEQSKLDTLASTISTTLNSVTNNGASNPPANSITGDTNVSTSTTLGGSTGQWRVAVTDQNGVVQSYSDINLSSISSVAGLVSVLNGISGVSASVTSAGKLQITSTNSSYGISLNEMNSNIGGMGASQFFGMNNLFVGTNGSAVNATNIKVSSALTGDSSLLPTAALSNSSSLAVGDNGVTGGDISSISALLNAMTANQSFTAAGSFASRTTSISNYANAIISGAATLASSAQSAADTSKATYTYLNNKYTNETGVNVDEETANMTALQTNYEATASLMSTIRDMFKTLIQVVGQS